MAQLITLIIFLISLAGIVFILYRKIPELAKLPKNGKVVFKKPQKIAEVEQALKNYYSFVFVKQVPLHKFLSKFRIFTLKIESRVDRLLQGLRKKTQELQEKAKKKKENPPE